ncbi:prolactin-releasing peptide [Lagopus muta]|uniref:prolactin-releasing peptide n=1 Tax=Lagopus muta TaxID=64668 RepID=UPI00209E830B|nr:prolactin-releasing peptide [Lagopus muta]
MGLAFPHGVPRWRSRGRDALSPSFLYQPDQGPAKGSCLLRDTLRTRLLCICARRLGLSPLPSRCRGRASGMKLGATCLLCLLLTCMAPPAAGRLRVHSMEIRSKESRNPDIDPFWYTGRGIRPVGRFGRRRALGESPQPRGAVLHPACIPPHTQPPLEQQSA